MNTVTYRLYANERLVSEDSFPEVNNEQPYYDDFYQTEVPASIEDEDGIIAYINAEMIGAITHERIARSNRNNPSVN